MPSENYLTAIVGGTTESVYRSRVVFISDDYKALMMTVNTSFSPFGVAQGSARQPPNTPFNTSMQAGISDQEIKVYGPGSTALAECGGTVTAGKMVTVDSTARIVDSSAPAAALSTPLWDLGLALEDGGAGDVVRIRVMPVNRGW